jgi:hypothetical protein
VYVSGRFWESTMTLVLMDTYITRMT